MTSRVRIKCSPAAFPHAASLMTWLLADGATCLGAAPGAQYLETICGHRLVANRLRCGGIDVKEFAS